MGREKSIGKCNVRKAQDTAKISGSLGSSVVSCLQTWTGWCVGGEGGEASSKTDNFKAHC
jgi:hypothetical protein